MLPQAQDQRELQNRLDTLASRLDAAQLNWASGYLAGLAAAGQADDAGVSSIEPGTILTIWYGSETGNGRGVAERLAASARESGYAVDLSSLADVQPRRISKTGLLLLVISTHGEGDPPEDAVALHKLLLGERAPRLDDLKFAVFALGDSSYPDFCQTGRELDERLSSLGAQRLLERVDVDVDFETAEDGWREQVLKVVKPLLKSETSSAPYLTVVGESFQSARVHDRRNPFQAELLESSPLTVAPSNKRVCHLALALDGSGLSYEPGDSLALWPRNDTRLVDEILELTGLDENEPVVRNDQTRPLREWLQSRLELTQVVRPFLAGYAQRGKVSDLLNLLDDRDALQRWVQSRQVVDVLREFPQEMSGAELVGLLRGIGPRLYSIASSPLVAEDEVHLTVKLEGGELGARLRAGVASWQLIEGSAPGDRLPVYIESNPRFRLPEEPDRPIIMIGPGTGVAPFRAFVEHRQALGHTGRNWLVFGEQHRRTDFLYQLEWQRHLKSGALNRLSVAFSRDQAEKFYVQHRLREQGSDVHAWLEEGAHVYVCGNGQGMANDVHQALLDVISRHGGRNPEQAAAYLEQLQVNKRYQKDVY